MVHSDFHKKPYTHLSIPFVEEFVALMLKDTFNKITMDKGSNHSLYFIYKNRNIYLNSHYTIRLLIETAFILFHTPVDRSMKIIRMHGVYSIQVREVMKYELGTVTDKPLDLILEVMETLYTISLIKDKYYTKLAKIYEHVKYDICPSYIKETGNSNPFANLHVEPILGAERGIRTIFPKDFRLLNMDAGNKNKAIHNKYLLSHEEYRAVLTAYIEEMQIYKILT